MNYPLLFLCLIVSLAVPLSARQKQPALKIYVFKARYTEGIDQYLRSHNYLSAHLIPQRMIDANNDLIIETDSVQKLLNSLYPGKDDTGTCVIDWEGKAAKNLMRNEKNSKDFRMTEDRFLELVGMIKQLRPRVRIGIYGLPFRVFYPSQLKYNAGNKFDKILDKCDFIAPSLYILFPDRQIGKGRNMEYLKQNLDVSFEYARRLNKPVIPFVWYKLASSGKLSGNGILSREEVQNYISFISAYRYEGKGIDGIIWWESSRRRLPGRKGIRDYAPQPEAANPDSILVRYTKPFINK